MPSSEFIQQSVVYREFLAERDEILRHKWLESVRMGHDIGFDQALLDWVRKHREYWRAARRVQLGGDLTGSRRDCRPPVAGKR